MDFVSCCAVSFTRNEEIALIDTECSIDFVYCYFSYFNKLNSTCFALFAHIGLRRAHTTSQGIERESEKFTSVHIINGSVTINEDILRFVVVGMAISTADSAVFAQHTFSHRATYNR